MRAPIEATGIDERIRNAAFALLLRDRKPIEPGALARIVGLDRAAAAAVFEDLARSGRIDRDDEGRITGAAGLSLEHGPHALTLPEGRYRTWCAYDALGIAAALGTDATIETACGQCGATIRFEVHAGAPQRREPERLWLAAGGDDLRADFCTATVLLCSPAHADEWARGHDHQGELFDLEAGATLGGEHWAACAAAAQVLGGRASAVDASRESAGQAT